MDNESPPYTTLYHRFVTFNPFVYEPLNHRAAPAPVLRLNPGDESPMFFLGVDPGNPNQVYYPNDGEQADLESEWDEIVIHAITIVDGVTVVRADYTLELPLEYLIPDNSTTQPGVNTPLRTESARFWATPVYRDDYIWATHHVRTTDTDENEVRWYRIKMIGWPDSQNNPELEEWGVIAPVAETSNATLFPSIAVNFWHDMLIAYHEVGPNQKVGVRYMLLPDGADVADAEYGWIKSDNLGVLSSAINGFIRWGDYSGTEADPTDWCTFWSYHMWAESGTTNKWKTWLSRNSMTSLCSQEFGPDYTRDGVVGSEDLDRFDALYRQQHRRADYNRDRTVDGLDYAAFLEAFCRQAR